MTDKDERTINRAVALLGDYYGTDGDEAMDVAEEARAALHRLFRDRRMLENELARLREEKRSADKACSDALRTTESYRRKLSKEQAQRDTLLAALREALYRLEQMAGGEDMCPNCVTPWKCNGPHTTIEDDIRAAISEVEGEK